ncbi:MAG TPA: CBS domain-containing protein, partial [Acidimicrobiales bacterium]|nr:CBS domain-containing protein [Acidimicrobiales bacterium]
ETPQEEWTTTTVTARMVTDIPTGRPDWLIRDALTVMETADVDVLPILDGGTFVGVVTVDEILKLDEILGEAGGEPPAPGQE